MTKDFYIKLLGVAIFIFFFICFYYKISDVLDNRNKILIKKIDDLELKINSLQSKKDSIRMVIDSTHIKIITNEKHYKEKVNTIISQPTSADYSFIREYIRQYRNQNDLNYIP